MRHTITAMIESIYDAGTYWLDEASHAVLYLLLAVHFRCGLCRMQYGNTCMGDFRRFPYISAAFRRFPCVSGFGVI